MAVVVFPSETKSIDKIVKGLLIPSPLCPPIILFVVAGMMRYRFCCSCSFFLNATSDVNGGDDDLLKIVNLLSFFMGKYSSAVLYCTVLDCCYGWPWPDLLVGPCSAIRRGIRFSSRSYLRIL